MSPHFGCYGEKTIQTPNGSYPAMGKGKTDYNFEYQAGIYDGTDWKTRKSGQPFFAQIQLWGGKTRDIPKQLAEARQQLGSVTPTDSLPLPPYYPRMPQRCKSCAPNSTSGWNRRTIKVARQNPQLSETSRS
jgi:hypothetical protein